MQTKMPEQVYVCLRCNDTLRTRMFAAVCSNPGCDWCDMVPADSIPDTWHLLSITFILSLCAFGFFIGWRVVQAVML